MSVERPSAALVAQLEKSGLRRWDAVPGADPKSLTGRLRTIWTEHGGGDGDQLWVHRSLENARMSLDELRKNSCMRKVAPYSLHGRVPKVG